jgi:hypothetical protein
MLGESLVRIFRLGSIPSGTTEFTGVHIVAGGRVSRESHTYLKEQFPNSVRAVSSRDKVLCKLAAGNADEVAAMRVLFPGLLQIAIEDAFQHARQMR